MSNGVMRVESNLPSKIEDLAQFVLVGRDKLAMVRAGIKALDKLDVAEGVRQQKKEEAQMLAEALLDAEVKIGEILARMPKASGKQENRGNRFTSRESNTTVTSSTSTQQPIETKQQAIAKLGFDKMQASRFETLAANKEIVEQIKQEARENDDLATRTAVLQVVKIKEREQSIVKQKKDIEQGNITAITDTYDVISIDPPWPYGREYDPSTSRVANPYPEMSIEEIGSINLPIKDDAVLLLWTTHKFLPDSFQLLEKWGFNYKATMVWDKKQIGMGAWFRMQCEFCVVGIKGKPIWENTTYSEIISERRREHSRKPDSFFELINRICYGKKLEYFSREAREGWDIFGNDTEKFK
jgi:N6-adenosine-specific RNA methylase IME4